MSKKNISKSSKQSQVLTSENLEEVKGGLVKLNVARPSINLIKLINAGPGDATASGRPGLLDLVSIRTSLTLR